MYNKMFFDIKKIMNTKDIIIIIIITIIIIIIIGLILYFTLLKKKDNYTKETSGIINVGTTYTFKSTDISTQNIFSITAKSSNDLNTDSLQIETSPDNITWIKTGLYALPISGGNYFYYSNMHANFIRVVFTNTTYGTSIDLYITF